VRLSGLEFIGSDYIRGQRITSVSLALDKRLGLSLNQ
jgi:hypothetical protein